MSSHLRAWAATVVVTIAAAACGGSTAPPSPAVSTLPPAAPSVAPSSSGSPAPDASSTPNLPPDDGALAWPSARFAPVPPGRHAISPPFDIPFTLDVPEGWHTVHVLGEFTDLAWFEGSADDGVPERVIAFGHPTTLRSEEDVPAVGLTVDEAVQLYRARPDLETSEAQPFEIDGQSGAWLDLHAPAFDTRLYSGPGTNGLGIGPDKEVRFVIVPMADGELLLVTVHADADDLDSTWDTALPILASVDFEE
jgi:hypothetical protein